MLNWVIDCFGLVGNTRVCMCVCVLVVYACVYMCLSLFLSLYCALFLCQKYGVDSKKFLK